MTMNNKTMAELIAPADGRAVEFWVNGMARVTRELGIPGWFEGGRFWSHDRADHWNPSEIREWAPSAVAGSRVN